MSDPSLEAKYEVPEEDQRTKKEKFREYIKEHLYVSWVLVNGYYLYGFCYSVVWNDIRKRHEAAAIVILSIFCYLNFFVYLAWFALVCWGPGHVTPAYADKDVDEDAAFQCSMNGYSLYCSYCRQTKPNRTHHASFTNTCVPSMDHFCPWVGDVVGQGNVKFFFQFCWTMCSTLSFVMIILFIYQHDQLPNINGNSIALYVISGLAIILAGILALQHFVYIIFGHTTLELMAARRDDGQYVNFLWRDGQRRVIQLDRMDVFVYKHDPFSRGIWNNIRQIMGPLYTWPLPIREPIFEPQYNLEFIEKLRLRQDKIEAAALDALKNDYVEE